MRLCFLWGSRVWEGGSGERPMGGGIILREVTEGLEATALKEAGVWSVGGWPHPGGQESQKGGRELHVPGFGSESSVSAYRRELGEQGPRAVREAGVGGGMQSPHQED